MTISFNSIPVDLRVPGSYIEFDNSRANAKLPGQFVRLLLIGQRLPTAAIAAGVPTLIPRYGLGGTYFGAGSMLGAMVDAARTANTYTETWAIALDDNPAGQAATGSVLIGGAPTANSTLTLYVAGVPVQVAVSTTQTPAQIATALAAAINATPSLTATAAVDAVTVAKVNITANHKGLAGNDIDLRTTYYSGDVLPAGLTAAITTMAGGTANPSLTPAIVAMGDVWYHNIGQPYTDPASLATMQTELARRFGPLVQKDGRAYSMMNATLGSASASGLALNTPHLTIMPISKMPSPTWVGTAVLAAQVAYYSPIDPAQPLDTLPLPGLLAPASGDQFIQSDRELLLHDGMSTYSVGDDGSMSIERLVTCYRVNAQDLPDTSYLNVETMTTLSYLRFWTRARISSKWPRYKLADDGNVFPTGQRVTTPRLIKLDLIAGANDLFAAGLIENLDEFKAAIATERSSANTSTVNALLPFHLVGQFRVFAGQIQFLE